MFFFKRRKQFNQEADEKYEKFTEDCEENKVGFRDRFAMMLSAYLVILLPCVLVLLALAGIMLLLIYLM